MANLVNQSITNGIQPPCPWARRHQTDQHVRTVGAYCAFLTQSARRYNLKLLGLEIQYELLLRPLFRNVTAK